MPHRRSVPKPAWVQRAPLATKPSSPAKKPRGLPRGFFVVRPAGRTHATLADDQGQTAGQGIHALAGTPGGHTQAARRGQDARHPDADGSTDPASVASSARTDLRGRILRVELRLPTGEERPSGGQGSAAVCGRRPPGRGPDRGGRVVVAMDLEKFFDRVNHDLLTA